MAAADVLQRLLNAAGFRIQKIGASQAGDDAARFNVPYLSIVGGAIHAMTGLTRSISADPAGAAIAITLPNPATWAGQSFFIMRLFGSSGSVDISPFSGSGIIDVNETVLGTLSLTGGQGLIFTSDGFNYSVR